MYCSNDDDEDCATVDTVTRVGLPLGRMFALEPLFYKYGVDLQIYGHEHSYERLFPIYNYTVSRLKLELLNYF